MLPGSSPRRQNRTLCLLRAGSELQILQARHPWDTQAAQEPGLEQPGCPGLHPVHPLAAGTGGAQLPAGWEGMLGRDAGDAANRAVGADVSPGAAGPSDAPRAVLELLPVVVGMSYRLCSTSLAPGASLGIHVYPPGEQQPWGLRAQ